MPGIIRMPLKETFSRRDVQRAASLNRWLIWNIIPKGPDKPYEIVGLYDKRDDEPEETGIHYIEDDRLQLRAGPGPAGKGSWGDGHARAGGPSTTGRQVCQRRSTSGSISPRPTAISPRCGSTGSRAG